LLVEKQDIFALKNKWISIKALKKAAQKTHPIYFAGISHSDELLYLYPRVGKPLNEEDTKIAKLMVKIFGNFIMTG